MKDKDNIEELFKEGLQDFQSPVDSSVWQGVQSGLSAASGAAGAGGAVSVAGKMSVLAKAVITIAGAAAVSISVYYFTSEETSEKEASKNLSIEKEISVEANEQTIETDDESIAFVAENKEKTQEVINAADLNSFTAHKGDNSESPNSG